MPYEYVIEGAGDSWSGWVPSVPGAFAVGETRAEVRRLLGEAADLLLEQRGREATRDRTPGPESAC